jgi:WYL_2, Sm-like SH3 beta-barrel fold
MMNIDQLRARLHEDIVQVVFTKANGVERTMNATLSDRYLPRDTNTWSADGKLPSETTISVWDLDAQDWRAFRMDSLKSIDGQPV